MALASKNVLVTGCSGLLGPALCEILIRHQVHPIGVDRIHHKQSRIHEIDGQDDGSIELITGDVKDRGLIDSILRRYNIKFVYHLAAQALVGEAAKNPVATFEDNILGTWTTLEACRTFAAENSDFGGIIVASSDKAYGEQKELPYLESAPMQGRFPYDVSKSCADLIAQSYFHSFHLPVCIARCGNIYGPGDLHLSRIVPGTILSLLSNERPVIRSDGTPVRDYVYVHDVADAYVHLSEAMTERRLLFGQAMNIANDQPVSVLEIVEILRNLMGKKEIQPLILNTASLEIQKQYLSSDQIRSQLGWFPQHNLENGLKKTIEWYTELSRSLPKAAEMKTSEV